MKAVNWSNVEAAFAKLPLPEQLEVVERLIRTLRRPPPEISVEQQRQAWKEMRKRLEGLPCPEPTDGLSGRDHDLILYGERQ